MTSRSLGTVFGYAPVRMTDLFRNQDGLSRGRHSSPVPRRVFRLAPFLAVLLLLSGSARSFAEAAKKFLVASDLHFNPFADPTLVAHLAAAPAAQWESILNRSKLTDYSRYGEDTNWWLLQSALDAMRATLPHPALILVPGDLLAHGFPQKYAAAAHDTDREHYRIFVLKTVAFLSLELRKRFPRSQIVITPGNNDDDCGDYQIEAAGPFLNDTESLVRNLVRAGGRVPVDWQALGSYAVQPRAVRGVRIISLNTVFFSDKYRAASFANACSAVDSDAAGRTFTWLESNLAQARAANQKVWLMFHIPPGIDGYSTMVTYRQLSRGVPPSQQLCQKSIVPMWKPASTARFAGIMRDYEGTITAAFAGHNHTDDFRVVNAGEAVPGLF